MADAGIIYVLEALRGVANTTIHFANGVKMPEEFASGANNRYLVGKVSKPVTSEKLRSWCIQTAGRDFYFNEDDVLLIEPSGGTPV